MYVGARRMLVCVRLVRLFAGKTLADNGTKDEPEVVVARVPITDNTIAHQVLSSHLPEFFGARTSVFL